MHPLTLALMGIFTKLCLAEIPKLAAIMVSGAKRDVNAQNPLTSAPMKTILVFTIAFSVMPGQALISQSRLPVNPACPPKKTKPTTEHENKRFKN
jgi:hypothetical protein